MSYYTAKKVKEIIKSYQHNNRLLEGRKPPMKSVGVAQGGIESVMPKASGGTSDVVASEAMRQIESNRYYAELATDIKYITDRWDRVTNECDAMILKHRLDGLSATDIALIMQCSRRKIYNRLDDIANAIAG